MIKIRWWFLFCKKEIIFNLEIRDIRDVFIAITKVSFKLGSLISNYNLVSIVVLFISTWNGSWCLEFQNVFWFLRFNFIKGTYKFFVFHSFNLINIFSLEYVFCQCLRDIVYLYSMISKTRGFEIDSWKTTDFMVAAAFSN